MPKLSQNDLEDERAENPAVIVNDPEHHASLSARAVPIPEPISHRPKHRTTLLEKQRADKADISAQR
jgi:hypothetical protein